MMTGLLRWPTLHWTLARAWTSASPAARDMLASRFGMANFYLGNVIGEFAGELLVNRLFLASALALASGRPRRHWLAFLGVAASTLGWIAMLRNLTPLVGPAATLNNLVLPLWMMTLGVVLVAQSRRHDLATR